MKITLYEYLALPDQEQYNVVFNVGTYIDMIPENGTRFVLYAIDLFFVEIDYNNLDNKIINKRSFVSGELLDKYSY